jgi:hypothetical protein
MTLSSESGQPLGKDVIDGRVRSQTWQFNNRTLFDIDPKYQSACVKLRSLSIVTESAAAEATEAIEGTEATHMLTVANHPYTPALNGGYVSVGSLYRDDSPPRNFKASADHHLFRMDTATNTYLLFSYGIHDTATWYIGVYPVLATDVDYLNNNSTTLGQTAQHSIGVGWNDFGTGSIGHYPTEAYSPSHTLTGVHTPGTPAVEAAPVASGADGDGIGTPTVTFHLAGTPMPNNTQSQLPESIGPSSILAVVPTATTNVVGSYTCTNTEFAGSVAETGRLCAGTVINSDLRVQIQANPMVGDDATAAFGLGEGVAGIESWTAEIEVQLLVNAPDTDSMDLG